MGRGSRFGTLGSWFELGGGSVQLRKFWAIDSASTSCSCPEWGRRLAARVRARRNGQAKIRSSLSHPPHRNQLWHSFQPCLVLYSRRIGREKKAKSCRNAERKSLARLTNRLQSSVDKQKPFTSIATLSWVRDARAR